MSLMIAVPRVQVILILVGGKECLLDYVQVRVYASPESEHIGELRK